MILGTQSERLRWEQICGVWSLRGSSVCFQIDIQDDQAVFKSLKQEVKGSDRGVHVSKYLHVESHHTELQLKHITSIQHHVVC